MIGEREGDNKAEDGGLAPPCMKNEKMEVLFCSAPKNMALAKLRSKFFFI